MSSENLFGKEISYLSNKPIAIFKIKNFLNKNLYDELKKNFPNVDKKKLNLETNTGQYLLDIENYNFESEKQKEVFLKFEKIIYSKKFFNFLKKNFFLKIAMRQNNFKRKLKYLRPAKFNNENSFLDFFSSKVKIYYNCSYICNNGSIVPHVDAQRKYLSLLLYFPDDDRKDIDYGTSFWKSNSPNYSNKHLQNKEELDNFKSKNNIFYKTPFEPNCIYGFIRNDFSWHSVEPINIDSGYIRKCININIKYLN